MDKKILLILVALATVGLLVLSSCSMFETTKRYAVEIQVKCPRDKQSFTVIPEILLAGGR